MPTLDYWERPELHRNFIDRSYLSVLLLNYIPTLLILTKLTKTNSAKGGKPNMTQQIGTAGIEPARWLFHCFFCQDRSHTGVKGYFAQKCPITHTRIMREDPQFPTSRNAPYPQRCALLLHCQTSAFSDFSLDWFSGYQQEEDSFYYLF